MAHVVWHNIRMDGGQYWADLCRYAVAPHKTSAYAAWIFGFHPDAVWMRRYPDKPDPRPLHYVSGIGLTDVDGAPAAFRETWRHFRRVPRGTAAVHIMQSFEPNDEISAEDAHSIGRELVKTVFPGAQAVVGTHLDRPHLHNHLVINGMLPQTGRSAGSLCPEGLYTVHAASNRLCDSYGLTRLDSADRERAGLWAHANRTALLRDVEYVRSRTDDPAEMAEMLRSFRHQVEVEPGGIWVKPEGWKVRIHLPPLAEVPAPQQRRPMRLRSLEGRAFRRQARSLTPLEAQTLEYLQILGSQRTARRTEISFREYKKMQLLTDALQYISAHRIQSMRELREQGGYMKAVHKAKKEELARKDVRRKHLHSLCRAACLVAFPGSRPPAEMQAARELLEAGPAPEEVREERLELERELLQAERANEECLRQYCLLRGFWQLEPQMQKALQREGLRRRTREREAALQRNRHPEERSALEYSWEDDWR